MLQVNDRIGRRATHDDLLKHAVREDSPEDFTLAMWPEPGGFFQWGSTIDGDAMGWMTEGEPEQWPVMVITHGDDEELLPETMTEWLAGWATGARFGAHALTEVISEK
ncbi:hypothetical protein AB0L05_15620 [Nonomuraea pusilla]|uniref:hypothetical protein n=1 Tax=Nonomuraea pusilla TaxID=46177 RepID=UPI003332FD26